MGFLSLVDDTLLSRLVLHWVFGLGLFLEWYLTLSRTLLSIMISMLLVVIGHSGPRSGNVQHDGVLRSSEFGLFWGRRW